MTLALVLLLGAVLVGAILPRALGYLPAVPIAPAVAVTIWLAGMLSFLYFAASAVVVVTWPGHAPAEGVVELLLRCLTRVQHTAGPQVKAAVAGIGLVLAGAVLARLAIHAHRHLDARSRVRRRHRALLRIVGRREDAAVVTLWVAHRTPVAYSLAGRPGFIVATEGLSDQLAPVELSAVLAHERAHLHDHHHLAVSFCDVLARVLPVVPLFAQAPAAVRILVELGADRAAVAATDRAAVRSALCKIASFAVASPAGVLAGGATSLEIRLRHLDLGAPAPSTRPCAPACAGAALLVLLLPVAAALLLIVASSALVCLVA